MEQLRMAVRQLVEFTLHGEDIRRLGGQLRDLREGVLGHKARQALLGDDWQAEVPLSLRIPVEEGELELLLSGRMDAFHRVVSANCSHVTDGSRTASRSGCQRGRRG